jgi:hypothetical protein
MSKHKKRLWIICIVALVLFCLYRSLGDPTITAWRARWSLAAALRDARSVALEQFTLIERGRPKVVASHNVPPSD